MIDKDLENMMYNDLKRGKITSGEYMNWSTQYNKTLYKQGDNVRILASMIEHGDDRILEGVIVGMVYIGINDVYWLVDFGKRVFENYEFNVMAVRKNCFYYGNGYQFRT